MKLNRIVRLFAVAVFALGVSFGFTNVASAAPTGLNCPSQLRVNFSTTCYFRANPYEGVIVTTSNTAVTAISPIVDGSGNGSFPIFGNRTGGVTICVYSSNGAFKTCDFVEVVP